MKKVFRTMLGGAVLCLPLMFTSCGNIDNPLEQVSAATIVVAPEVSSNEIYAGSSTALVTIATADGGTVMYKVTTTNERPTSTEGFTATVPTAEDLTDFGTYYVWYYVKGEGIHGSSAISATAVEVFLLPSLSTPLTMEAITAGTITITTPKVNMKYKKNNESIVTITSTDDVDISVAAGDKVEFYGNGTSIEKYYNGGGVGTKITGGTAQVKMYGNIMSLIDETGFASNETLTKSETFYHLFHNNTTLTDASCLLLPATTLTTCCYSQMFEGCTSLENAPQLPAGGEKGTLANQCYEQMFLNCSALTTAPELPATTLQANCYRSMFKGCTSLENAPQLPATDLANQCYGSMFESCTSLENAPKLPATDLADLCYYRMFMGCTSLEKAPKLPATDLANYCYHSMFTNCTSLNEAWVKANYKAGSPGHECEYMFYGCTTAGTDRKLHTLSGNTASWEAVMPSTWATWTVYGDYND